MIAIASISSYLPARAVSTQEIIERFGLRIKADWVENRIGIRSRHWAEDDQAASDLAAEAARGLNLEGFAGPIWLSTISPDHLTPSTSSILKRKLGLKDSFPAVDIAASCAGFVFALDAARSWMMAHPEATEALVVASELRSKFINKQDRRTVFLFADGAVAVKLVRSKLPTEGIEWIETLTIASDDVEILVPAGGSKEPVTTDGLAAGRHYISMNDGAKIRSMATEALAGQVKQLLEKHRSRVEDYDLVISHQANQSINVKLFELLGIEASRGFSNIATTGNCSSASVALALHAAQREGRLKPGMKVLLLTMGAGYHIGLSSIVWTAES